MKKMEIWFVTELHFCHVKPEEKNLLLIFAYLILDQVCQKESFSPK